MKHRKAMSSSRVCGLLLALWGWTCSLHPASAQSPANLPLVGVLRLDTVETVKPVEAIFRNAMTSLGQIDRTNVRIEFRLAEGHADRFPELALGFVRDRASVIVASGDAAVRAAQQATKTIPIIGIVDDIVGSGLIASLARPGGNTTGVSILATELDGKKLDILKRITGSGKRFGVLNDPSSAQAQPQLLLETAKALGVELVMQDVRSPVDFAGAFAQFRAVNADAVMMRSSPLLFGFRKELCELANTQKLPAIGQNRQMAEAGCVASYGVRLAEMHSLSAVFVDKMLRGARPENTPAQQPTKTELVINHKSARALGLSLPAFLLAEADELIE
jgi:putative ABC transport system substrate-binding protein